MKNREALMRQFQKEAEAVSAVVRRVNGLEDVWRYVAELCSRDDGVNAALSAGDRTVSQSQESCGGVVVAAHSLGEANSRSLEEACLAAGARLISHGLRDYRQGVAVGVTFAEYGLAETGTLVLDSSSEEFRLATMLSQIHVAILPVSKMRESVRELADELAGMMEKEDAYVAFITGASRTTDIEMDLVLGVHGPLELHVVMVDGL